MRIIAGSLRGRKIVAPATFAVRPTTDRVKQVIFDTLTARMDFEEIHVLDAFCGGGSLGLESISRGASQTVFVDQSIDSIRTVRENIRSLGIEQSGQVIQTDAVHFIGSAPQDFDLVFIDPPYAMDRLATLPSLADKSGIVKPDGWLVMKFPSTTHITEEGSTIGSLFVDRLRRFGETSVLFLHHRMKAS